MTIVAGRAEHRVEQLHLAVRGPATELDRVVVTVRVIVRVGVALAPTGPVAEERRPEPVAVLADAAGGEHGTPDVLGGEGRPGYRVVDRHDGVDPRRRRVGRHRHRVDRDEGEVVALPAVGVQQVVARFRVEGAEPDLEVPVRDVTRRPRESPGVGRTAEDRPRARCRIRAGQVDHLVRGGPGRAVVIRKLDGKPAACRVARLRLDPDLESSDGVGGGNGQAEVGVHLRLARAALADDAGGVRVVAGETLAAVRELVEQAARRSEARKTGSMGLAGAARLALEESHAVVVLRAAHRHGQHELGLRCPDQGDRVDPEHAHEEGVDGGRDADVQAPVVARVLEGGDGRPGSVDVAVLAGLADGRGLGLRLGRRQPDDARQGGGIGGALDLQGVTPVPGDVENQGDHAGQCDRRNGEDHKDLAPPALPPGGGGPRRCRHVGLTAMMVRSEIVMEPDPNARTNVPSGVIRS